MKHVGKGTRTRKVAAVGRMAIITCVIFTGNAAIAGDITSGKGLLILNDEAPALVTPTIQSRLRYEYGDQDGLRESHNGTLRNRIGLLTREFSGVRFFAEYEGTLALDRDSYNDATGRRPSNRTVIADPESHELNQLWATYRTSDDLLTVKAGRQGINLDNQRFIGTVGWRQNMQTYDAASLMIKPTKDLDLYYGYIWQVNRIFGSEVVRAGGMDFEGNSHLLNANYRGLSFGVLSAYAYLLDLHNNVGDANSNNTFGLSLSGDLCDTHLTYHAEYAYQTNAYDSPLNYSAHYAHGAVSFPVIEGVEGTVGLEYLGADNGSGFRTPLATLHKFNGFADRFLATPGIGLADLYGNVGFGLPCKIGASVGYHCFWDDDFGVTLGNEVDLVLKKDLGGGFSVLAKGAFFDGQNGQPDVNRATVEMNFTY